MVRSGAWIWAMAERWMFRSRRVLSRGSRCGWKVRGSASEFGGPPGDTLLEITVRENDVWERDGNNLRMKVSINLQTAVKGGAVDVKTPSGTVTLKVPAGSNTGAVLRLGNKGVQGKKPGHLYARLEIMLDDPKDAGLKKWAETSDG